MKKITFLIAFLLSLITGAYAQTVLIDPAGGGGFAIGNTFASNGWTVANSANNPWYVGTVAASGAMAGNVAYISSATNGTAHTYNVGNASVNYFWRDVTVPAGQTKITLSLDWYGQGESTWDLWQAFYAPTTVTPVAAAASAGSGVDLVPTGITGAAFIGYGNLQGTVQTATFSLPASLAGTTFRLIFSWKSDTSTGVQPPAALDNISLTSQALGDYVSIASGNWSSPSTWNLNSVPDARDTSVTVAAGHTVTVNTAGQTTPNTTVNGTIAYGATSTALTVAGNLTIASGGLVNVFNGTTGKTLAVNGNIINNGSIDVSVGATTEGNLTFNGSTVQTLSGTGSFVNNTIRNLIFSNTNTTIPNINWQMNNISVDYNLNISNAKINLGTNKLTFGTSITSIGNTFTFGNGGFIDGGKFARWWGNATVGYVTSGPTSIPTDAVGGYPFYKLDGIPRVFYLGRTTPTVGGVYAVSFNDATTLTTGLSIPDGANTITDRWNGNFIVSTEGTTPVAASNWISIFVPNAYTIFNGNSRILGQTAAISGTHINGTPIPSTQRSGVLTSDLTAATGLYLGFNSEDVLYVSVANGDWNNPATWNKGTVPLCTSTVSIAAGTNVTINSAANVVKGLSIVSGGTLTVASGDLTVGCTLKNNSFINNGTLTVTGGVLNINGNMLHNAASTFNQSGGNINIDGNDGGAAATSVASGVSIVQLNSQFINWTGGMLTIIDPHANTTASNSLAYDNSTANVNVTAGHTLRFGDGVSTDAGGNANGFRVNTWVGSNRITFNNFIVNGGTGTNRHVGSTYTFGINANLTVNANSEYRDNSVTTYVTGNIQNNGAYTATGTLAFGTYLGGTAGASTLAQTVSGTGTFANSASTPTANFVGLTVNNSNVAGVTFANGTSNIATQPANSISVSGALTFTAGKVNALGNATFILGVSTTSLGSLSYTSGGFVSGITFGRWFGATTVGSTIAAGVDASASASRYPFVNSFNQDRSTFVERTAPVAASGVLGVTYNNVAGTTAINVTDTAPSFVVDTKANDTWAVSVISGTPTAATSFELQLLAPGIFGGTTLAPTARIIQGTSLVGTHQAGTITPGAQRILTAAQLIAGPFSMATAATDVPFASVTNGDWNSPATWNKNAVPACTDIVNITPGTIVTVNAAGAVSKNTTIALGGTLTVASGDLIVGCTLKNNSLVNNGTLTVTGGTLTVNGNMIHSAASIFNQSGGDINIDGNDAGVAANSVASGVSIVQINSQFVNWTGGMLTIVDPHANSTASNTFTYSNSLAVNVTAGHTIRFGDGVSTDAGGNATNGFRVSTGTGSGRISFNNFIVNTGAGTNRYVTVTNAFGINGNMTINANGEYRDNASATYIAGNVQNDGKYTGTGTMVFGTYLGGTAAPSTLAQTVSGIGTFANSATTPTANLVSMTVNNSNATGVTLNVPLSLSGTLTLTEGKLNTTTANILTLGTATAAGTLTGGSATAYVVGPIARTIGNANASTNYILFPTGKAAYAPIWLAPVTTAVSVMKAETFDTNTGTSDASIINLAANRRWETLLVSGTITDINLRLGDTNLANDNIPATAPTADGVYAGTFGSAATYVAGTPNTIQSLSAISAANYSGFISYAKSNLCAGTPTPGNTIASATAICTGATVSLSVQNITLGSGVTYQWQSSPDNVTYTDIASATNTTYVTTPTTSLYYQLKVTCATGPATGISTPIHVTFANSITASTPGLRCGKGTVSLEATANTGATVKWYAAATGGAAIATGSPFVTPSIDATTTYYAAAETPIGGIIAGAARVAPTATSGTTASSYGLEFTATNAFVLNSVDVFLNSSTAGNVEVILTDLSGATLQTVTLAVPAGNSTTPVKSTLNLAWNITPGSYRILAASGPSMVRESSLGGFPYSLGSVGSITNGYINGTSQTYYFFYNWSLTGPCTSTRVPVVATVNTPPAFTLSAAPAAVCSGQTTTAVTITAGAADYNTYVWTPSTGVAGNATTGWTFNPATSTVYSLQASNSTGTMCVAVPVTVNIVINALPTAIVTAPTVAVCEGTAQALTATGGINITQIAQENFDILSTQFTATNTTGTGTATLNSTYFSQGTGSVLLKAANSSDVNYSLNGNLDLTPYTGAQLTFSHIAAFEGTGFSYDLGYVQYSSDGGTTWVTFPTSSYVGAGALITQQGTSTPVDGVIFSTKSYPDWTTQFIDSSALPNSTTLWKTETINIPAAALTNQFKIRFRSTTDGSTIFYGWLIDNLKITDQKSNLVWSPATNLYTDAAATVPYTGQSLGTVYVKPTAATSYTVTSTSSAGCSVSAPVAITINVVAAPTVPAPTQDICNAGTVANLVATGTGIKWYAAAAGGTALVGTTALVNGTTYYASQTVNGCESVSRIARLVNITVINPPTVPAPTQDICNAGTVANLIATGTDVKWYAATTGGTALLSTADLVNGAIYYASQTIGNCESATRTALTVNITLIAVPTVPALIQQICNSGAVGELITDSGVNIKWYADATGGTALESSLALVDDTTYYASQTIGTCESVTRTALTVNINVIPAPTGNATQAFCSESTVGDLTVDGNAILWYDEAIGGNLVPATTPIVSGTTYYASQNIDGCESIVRLAVEGVITPALVDDLADVNECSQYTLPVLTNGSYFTETNGAGTALAAGGVITQTTTIYVYTSVGTNPVCTAESSFVVTIANVPAPQGAATQTINVDTPADATIEDIVVTLDAGGTIVWYATEEDASNGTNALPVTTELVNGEDYYATQTIGTCTSIVALKVTIDVVLGKDTFVKDVFTYYPNPVKDVLNLSYSSDITSIAVFNLLGQQVLSQQPNAGEAKIDMSSFADGAYIVNVTSGSTIKTIKVIKKQ